MKKYYPLLTVILLGLPLCSQALTLNLRGGYRSASHAYETLIQVSQGWNNGWWASFESNTWNTIHNNENELFALNYNKIDINKTYKIDSSTSHNTLPEPNTISFPKNFPVTKL